VALLNNFLRSAGFDVFFDNFPNHDQYLQQAQNFLRNADVVIFCCSQNFLASINLPISHAAQEYNFIATHLPDKPTFSVLLDQAQLNQFPATINQNCVIQRFGANGSINPDFNATEK
jgi:hypothetical protein